MEFLLHFVIATGWPTVAFLIATRELFTLSRRAVVLTGLIFYGALIAMAVFSMETGRVSMVQSIASICGTLASPVLAYLLVRYGPKHRLGEKGPSVPPDPQ